MFTRMIKALDRCVIEAAARGLEREIARDPAPASCERRTRHPDYFEEFDTTKVELTFYKPTYFCFPSPIESGSEVNDTVHGRFWPERPRRSDSDGQRKAPLAILLHGWNGEKGYDYLFPLLARRLANLGLATAVMELPYHGRRKPRSGGYRNFLSGDLQHMMEATRQAIADIRALIHWARRQGYESIGLWGVSLGAWLGGLTACAEPGLRGLILMSPVPKIDLAIEQLAFCRHIREGMKGKDITAESLNLIAHRPKMEPERLLLIESVHDLFAPAETIESLWQEWGNPEIWRVEHGHISVLLSPRINNRAARWLKDKLEEPTPSAGPSH